MFSITWDLTKLVDAGDLVDGGDCNRLGSDHPWRSQLVLTDAGETRRREGQVSIVDLFRAEPRSISEALSVLW